MKFLCVVEMNSIGNSANRRQCSRARSNRHGYVEFYEDGSGPARPLLGCKH
jgi:hypothetical protein